MMIMTVDDSSTMRKIVGLALKVGRYDLIEAEDGLDALEKLKSTKVDFFIMDVNMPRMNGIDLAKKVREMPDYQKTPILMLTTESDKSMINKGVESGASGWMIKPFQNEDLLSTVQKLIK